MQAIALYVNTDKQLKNTVAKTGKNIQPYNNSISLNNIWYKDLQVYSMYGQSMNKELLLLLM